MSNVTTDEVTQDKYARQSINVLKIALMKGIKMHQVPRDWICRTCKEVENSFCSAPHPCPDCRYFPYLNGKFVGCMCGVDPCTTCGGTTLMTIYNGNQINCMDCAYPPRKHLTCHDQTEGVCDIV